MRPQIVLTQIARSGLHFAHLCTCAGHDGDSRPDPVPVGARPCETDRNRVQCVPTGVPEHVRRASVVRDDQIHIPVVVDVTANEGAPDIVSREAGARLPADLGESTSVRVLEQRFPLRMGRPRSNSAVLSITCPLTIDRLQICVVVEIEERDTKAHERAVSVR